jgi:CheY-like chemotaxis protein
VQSTVASQLLRVLGYDVVVANSGEAGIEAARARQFDLIVLDMIMPGGLDGTDTYRQLAELRPGQRAIILSGFSESERVIEAQRLGAGAFVHKPVSLEALARAVRTELDRAPTPAPASPGPGLAGA